MIRTSAQVPELFARRLTCHDTPCMEVGTDPRGEGTGFVIFASTLEIAALANGLNEALDAIEDWEFQTRVGVTKPEARQLIESLWLPEAPR